MTDEVEVVRAERLRAEAGHVGTHGRDGEIRRAAPDHIDARVRQLIVQRQLNARMPRRKRRQHPRENARRNGRQRRHCYASGAGSGTIAQLRKGGLEIGQQAQCGFGKRFALGCQFNMARVAVEQAHAGIGLQVLDQRAEGRLRQVARLCRLREVFVLAQRGKGAELFDREVHGEGRA